MITHEIDLPEYHWNLIEQMIASGRYKDISDVIGAALRLLEHHEQSFDPAGTKTPPRDT